MPTATATRKSPDLGRLYGKHQDRYLELICRFPLRPIRTEAELDAATEVIHSLIDLKRRNKAEEDYLDVLGDLVEAYEDVHYPMDEPSDGDMLRFLIEQKGVTQTVVARDAGLAASTVSEVLAGKRTLTRAQIGKLARFFHVEPGVFRFDG